MPTSDSWGKDWVYDRLQEISARRPVTTVTDVGAGQGTYSDLLRDTIGISWLAVEAWGPYIAEYGLNAKYDHVVVADMMWVDECVLYADLVIFGDVLEHVSPENAMHIIGRTMLVGKNSKHNPDRIIVICIPVLHLEQGAVNGNPFEVHDMHNHWTADNMERFLREEMLPGSKLDMHVGDVVAYFIVTQGRYANA